MNDKLYSTALSNYKKWADSNKAEVESDFNERHAMCKDMQSYTKERLQNLTEEESLLCETLCLCGFINFYVLVYGSHFGRG